MNNKTLTIIGIVLGVILIGLIINLFINLKGSENMSKDTNQAVVLETTNQVVVLETSKGNIEIELYADKSPKTVANFITYVNSGYYDGLVFHRVIKGFMVQGGGFNKFAVEKKTNSPIVLESNNGLKNLTGTVAMARTNAPNSATSQFFISTVDNDFLDYAGTSNPGYAVFGKVIKGMHIVFEIENVKTATKNGNGDWPVENIIITKAYMK
jgi:peptidyl-prolyl cis-trans isomerase A (cyclophilin A)